MKRLLVLLCVVPLLAACGGSSKPSAATTAPAVSTAATSTAAAPAKPKPATPPPPPALVARANAACRVYHRELASFGTPTTANQISVYYAKLHVALQVLVDQLSALRPHNAAVDAFVAASRAELKPVLQMAAAAASNNASSIRSVAVTGALLDKRAHAAAVTAHLSACAETAS